MGSVCVSWLLTKVLNARSLVCSNIPRLLKYGFSWIYAPIILYRAFWICHTWTIPCRRPLAQSSGERLFLLEKIWTPIWLIDLQSPTGVLSLEREKVALYRNCYSSDDIIRVSGWVPCHLRRGRSKFWIELNKIGEGQEPCGLPAVIGRDPENSLLSLTHNERSERKD